MPNQDSIKLLNDCNSGTKMAVESLNEVLEKVKNENLRNTLTTSLDEHKTFGDFCLLYTSRCV